MVVLECLYFANPNEMMALDNDCQFLLASQEEKQRVIICSLMEELNTTHITELKKKKKSCLYFYLPISRKYRRQINDFRNIIGKQTAIQTVENSRINNLVSSINNLQRFEEKQEMEEGRDPKDQSRFKGLIN